MHKRQILAVIIVGLILPFASKSDNAKAFPGSNRDEECEKLIEQAVLSIDAGQTIQ